MHMHELDPPLIHRDVKSPHILLTASLPDARARLADLGCTKVGWVSPVMTPTPFLFEWHLMLRVVCRCTCKVRR
jgi:hypothetical protein